VALSTSTAPSGSPSAQERVELGRTRRRIGRLVALVLGPPALVFVSAAAVRFGAAGLSWQEFFHAYLHYSGTDDDLIVRQLRGPRVLVAIEVGAALAVAGALMQGLTRNPLADSGILGINAGAALFVVIGIAEFGATKPNQFVWFAFPGAALGTGLSLSLALLGRGKTTPLKLTLAGVITGAILGAATEMVVFLNPVIGGAYRFWAVGDVGGRTMSVVKATAPVIVVGLALGIVLGRALNGLSLGEEMARGLGQHVGRTRFGASLAAVLLAGAAVAAAGPIAFVGLAAPNAVRALVGNDYRWIARIILRPEEIETGIAISFVGAPIFLYLVTRRRIKQI
jgi:iron complex transport system permease protein